MLSGAEVAQLGEHSTQQHIVVKGEAEDRVVAGSSPALGTITLSFRKEPVLRNFAGIVATKWRWELSFAQNAEPVRNKLKKRI